VQRGTDAGRRGGGEVLMLIGANELQSGISSAMTLCATRFRSSFRSR
jgi:hypothetical protein